MKTHKHKRRIGLLGGSFNPAHEGHVHISTLSLEALGLDEVWWLVSPQNPLKSMSNMASFAERYAQAKICATINPRIHVSNVETHLGTCFTVDSLKAIKNHYPDCAFVWIVGADNLRQMPKWKGWREIFRTVPIAVFPRAPYSIRALGGRAARCFDAGRIEVRQAKKLVNMPPPAWVFLKAPKHGASSTSIRYKAKI